MKLKQNAPCGRPVYRKEVPDDAHRQRLITDSAGYCKTYRTPRIKHTNSGRRRKPSETTSLRLSHWYQGRRRTHVVPYTMVGRRYQWRQTKCGEPYSPTVSCALQTAAAQKKTLEWAVRKTQQIRNPTEGKSNRAKNRFITKNI